MNQWMILVGAFFHKKHKPNFSRSAYVNQKAEILGKVFVGENSNIGQSKIIAEDNHTIIIGRNTTIKNHVLIKVKTIHESKLDQINGIFIGNKVFISSEVFIYGPTVIADDTFIGSRTTISNAAIGTNCLIEDNVYIKNVLIPSGTVIPSKSYIDSTEKLNQIISNNSEANFCEFKC